jgi:DNA primase
VIELNTRSAPSPQLSAPGRFILNFDQDQSLVCDMMRDGAVLIKVVLDEVGLDLHLKTSGADGR